MSIKIKRVLSVPFMENGYIVYDENNEKRECVVIDPGLDPIKFAAVLEEKELTPVVFLCTHGHADHIAGIGPLREVFPDAQIVMGAEDAKKLTDAYENLSAMFGISLTAPPADMVLFADFADTGKTAETLHFAGLEFEARRTPGHSAGHTVFWLKGCEPDVVFVGDLILEQSVGRTDFPDGDFDQLAASIRQQIYTFPDTTILYPGHGDKTTVGVEKRLNLAVPAVE